MLTQLNSTQLKLRAFKKYFACIGLLVISQVSQADYTYTNINGTAYGINNSGEVVGYIGYSGSIYNNGIYTNFNFPGANWITAQAINNNGDVVGAYGIGSNAYGFLYNNGTFTSFSDPNNLNVTFLSGINDSGVIVGQYNNTSTASGFVYKNGFYTDLNDPNATNGGAATAINNNGEIVGWYQTSTNILGYRYNNGVYTTIDLTNIYPGYSTYLTGVNDSGQIIGYVWDGSTASSFLATPAPVPVPSAIWLFATALVGLLGIKRRSKFQD